MEKIKGIYINLATSYDRRLKMESQLKEMMLIDKYERFNAIAGNKNKAEKLGLSTGELGIWESWLEILRKESENDQSEYAYLHIMEDDAVLSKEFAAFREAINKIKPIFDMLVTDMYVNPSIYTSLAKQHNKYKRKGEYLICSDIYTGCLSSVIIPRTKIKKIYELLSEVFRRKEESKLPLDNQIRLNAEKKEIKISRVAPFITTVRRESINQTTIQPRETHTKSVRLTQDFNYELRRFLSTLDDVDTTPNMLRILQEIAGIRHLECNREINTIIIEKIIEIASDKDILQYAYPKKLLGQPGNQQRSSEFF